MSNRSGRTALTLAAALAPALALAPVLVASPAVAAPRATRVPEAPRLPSGQITVKDQLAATGMAADTNNTVFWVVKDAKSSTLTAVGPDGSTRGSLDFDEQVTGLSALAMRNGVLYAADFADPSADRQSVALYRIADPGFGRATASKRNFRYDDGAHDSGAVMVSPKGNVYVVTRGDKPGIYRASMPSEGRTGTLKRLADAPGKVSDAVFLPGGNAFALWGAEGLEVRDAYSLERQSIGPNADDGEAIALGLDGNGIALAHHTTPMRIEVVDRPTGNNPATTAPSASATASSSAQASGTPSSQGSEGSNSSNSATGGIDNSIGGTTWAILGAAGLAVVAGLVTLVAGRRRG